MSAIYREARIEAENGGISEGQLPDEYVIRWEPADDVVIITESKDEQRVILTAASLRSLVREVERLRGAQ